MNQDKEIKLLEYNIEENLDDFGIDNDFLDTKTIISRRKKLNWNSLKLKTTSLQRNIVKRIKQQATGRKKVCKTHIQIYKKPNIRRTLKIHK